MQSTEMMLNGKGRVQKEDVEERRWCSVPWVSYVFCLRFTGETCLSEL